MKIHRPLFYSGAGLVVAGAVYSIVNTINYAVLSLWFLCFCLIEADYIKRKK